MSQRERERKATNIYSWWF